MCRNALHPDHSITDRFDQSTDHARGGEMEETENKLTKGIASNAALSTMNATKAGINQRRWAKSNATVWNTRSSETSRR